MSIQYFLPFLCVLLSAPSASARGKTYEVTAIAFYNLENLFDTEDDPANRGDDEFTPSGPYRYTEDIYRQKLHNLATVLQRLGADITPDGPALIGVAEIENAKVLEDLCAQPEIRDRGYRFVHFDSPDGRGIDVGLLYHPTYFTVLSARPLLVDLSKTGQKRGATRDILYVHGILAGDTIDVLVNHWPSRRGGEAATAPLRSLAAGVGKKLIDSLIDARPATKAVLMGDLNDDPVDISITGVLGATGDKNRMLPGGIYNPWLSFFRNGTGTLGYNDSWNLFDQILVSGTWLHSDDSHWRYYRAEVFNREFLKSSFGRWKGYPHRSFSNNQWINGYSDHFPAIIYLIRTSS